MKQRSLLLKAKYVEKSVFEAVIETNIDIIFHLSILKNSSGTRKNRLHNLIFTAKLQNHDQHLKCHL